MTNAYFAPLVTLPVVIVAPGDYFTRKGERVTVFSISTKHDFGCLGYIDGVLESWHKSGRTLASSETRNDILKRAEEKA